VGTAPHKKGPHSERELVRRTREKSLIKKGENKKGRAAGEKLSLFLPRGLSQSRNGSSGGKKGAGPPESLASLVCKKGKSVY